MKKKIIISLFFLLCLSINSYTSSVNAYTDLSTYRIKTGKFENETIAQTSLNNLTKETGWSGDIQVSGKQDYYQVLSGGFAGENRVKGILDEFEDSTGIKGTYEGIGEPEKFYEVISGRFKSEDRIKEVLREFKDSTGLEASYIYIGQNTYKIKTKPILGTKNLSKAKNFFISHNWWFSSTTTGQKSYERFRIRSVPVLGNAIVNRGKNFFVQNNWYAKTTEPGKVGYIRFRIKTAPILGSETLKKAKDFFYKNNWHISTRTTGEVGFQYYKIKTVPLFDSDLIEKAKKFFEKK